MRKAKWMNDKEYVEEAAEYGAKELDAQRVPNGWVYECDDGYRLCTDPIDLARLARAMPCEADHDSGAYGGMWGDGEMEHWTPDAWDYVNAQGDAQIKWYEQMRRKHSLCDENGELLSLDASRNA